MDAANTQDQAKKAWITPYTFESMNGGLGTRLSVTGSSSRGALVGEGAAMTLCNPGTVTVYAAWGTSGVTATTSGWPVLPGTKEVVSLPKNGTATYVAGITESGTSTLLAHMGYGI